MTWLPSGPAFAPENGRRVIPVIAIDIRAENPVAELDPMDLSYANRACWVPKAGRHLALRDSDGTLRSVLYAIDDRDWRRSGIAFPFGDLPTILPVADQSGDRLAYSIHAARTGLNVEMAALGWLLGSYLTRVQDDDEVAALIAPADLDTARLETIATGVWLARRLINAPANQLGVEALETAAREVAEAHAAEITSVIGDELLAENWPLIHAVGRAGPEPPRLVDLRWGDKAAPRITLVGKGVVFDTGGLDIKPARAMRLMKKDMGGAAAALALAHMMMAQKLPIRLRVLLPIAENSVASNAIRPGDVLPSRKGLTVEIGDTDAEGRLLLADALAAASEECPDLLVDFATLTGSATAALGIDLPALFTADDRLAAEIATAGLKARDPVWPLPLWSPYDKSLATPFADVSSTGSSRFGGAITAALFLQRFVINPETWVHFDIHAWRTTASPGRPIGGECQTALAMFHLLEQRYGGR